MCISARGNESGSNVSMNIVLFNGEKMYCCGLFVCVVSLYTASRLFKVTSVLSLRLVLLLLLLLLVYYYLNV